MNNGAGNPGFRAHPVCLITGTPPPPFSLEQAVSLLLEAGIRWVQYREKHKTKREMLREALELKELARKYNACLIINDHADIALAVDADGVHLGQDDLPLAEARRILGAKIIGISTHSAEEAMQAEQGGADYIGFGPVFHTETKDAGAPKGVDILRRIRNSVGIPVVAIGGIKTGNARSVFETECRIAVSSGLLAGDLVENAKGFLSAFTSCAPGRGLHGGKTAS